MSVNPFNPTDPKIPVSPFSLKEQLNWKPRIAAHIEPWFNTASTSHLNIGYTSNDPKIVASQVAFLKARGVDFVIFDWYGKDSKFEDSTCLAWKVECEKQGLNFAFCFDYGLVKFHLPTGMTPTDYMKANFQYVLNTYCSSPNYEKTASGKFLVIEFGWEGQTNFDAGAVLTAFPQFAMCWENAGGYGKPNSAGAFAWVGLNSADPQGCIEAYQTNFLATAAKNPNAITIGSLCKGFDDHARKPGSDPTQSCWGGPARFADEKQGQTFLNVIDLYNKSTFKPQYLQLVTFNDHEEGTNLEWGIDSTLQAAITQTGGIVTVALTGNAATVHHIELYVDNKLVVSFTDATKPMTFDLNTLPLGPGAHSIQAVVVGKAMFQQKVSNILQAKAGYVWS